MALLVIALIVAWLAIILLCWAFFQLVGRHGALLIRLEALESALANGAGAPPSGYDDLPVGSVAQELGLPSGSVLQDFALPDLDGTMMRLSQWRGRRLLLIFFDPACGFCQQLLPMLAGLQPDGDPLPVVITTGDRELNRRLFAEHTVAILVLLQDGGEVAAICGVPGTPTGYLVDAEGRTAAPAALGADAILALAGVGPRSVTPSSDLPITRAVPASRLLRSGLPTGSPAPAFRLPRIDGGELALDDYRGRRVLLVFSDPGCGPCQDLAPDLERIHRDRPDLAVLMVSRNGLDANREKAAEHGLTFPIALQRHWEISREYGMFATPIAFLIDEKGTIAADVAVGGESILALAGAPDRAGSTR